MICNSTTSAQAPLIVFSERLIKQKDKVHYITHEGPSYARRTMGTQLSRTGGPSNKTLRKEGKSL